MRRPLVALALAIALIGGFAASLAWLLNDPGVRANAPRGERLYAAYCVDCHGVDGRGSWRAALFLLRPPDLTDRARQSTMTDRYMFDLIKSGGAPFGRPGMPSFGYQMSDADIELVAAYVRTLALPSP
jgi:mono/diheme cytochrome c family protein